MAYLVDENGRIDSVNFRFKPSWQVEGLGDINGDGKADILWKILSRNRYLYFLCDDTTRIPILATLGALR